MVTQPIKPNEIQQRQMDAIDDAVIEVWNNLITKNFRGKQAVVYQDDAITAIQSVMGVDRSDVFKNGWLEIEPLFQRAGWKVEYDKPGYNESYRASFTFTKP